MIEGLDILVMFWSLPRTTVLVPIASPAEISILKILDSIRKAAPVDHNFARVPSRAGDWRNTLQHQLAYILCFGMLVRPS